MGKALFDNQFAEEEVCKKAISKPGISAEQELLIFDISPRLVLLVRSRELTGNTILHQHPVTDIIVPPPNA